MTKELRILALQLAANAAESVATVVDRAQRYFTFLIGADAAPDSYPETETPAAVAPAKRGRKAAVESVQPAATPAATATAPAVLPPAQSPAAPSAPAVKIEAVNAAILKLAGKNRDKALGVLATYKVTRTPELKPDQYQAVIDTVDEELAKLDAASVQASLV